MSKRTAAITLAGALLLAGCSAPAIDKDAVYLKLVHEKTSSTSSDSDLVDMAKGACEQLESGSSMKDLENAVAATELTQTSKIELARIVGFGVGVYCPEFL
jgi:PBP1b-binding outer membrane lipoprotein LpoB